MTDQYEYPLKIVYPGDDRLIQMTQNQLTREQFIEIAEFDHPSINMNMSDWVFKGTRKNIDASWYAEEVNNALDNVSTLTDLHSATNDNLLGCFVVEFNVTDLCNRHCWMCPHHNENLFPNRKVFMELETVKNTVDDLVKHNFKGEIIFGSYGEPLLCPNLMSMIAYTSEKLPECSTTLISNADRLIKGSIPGYGKFDVQDIIDSGLTNLQVDGYDNDARLALYLKELKPLIGIVNLELHRRYMNKMAKSYLTRAGIMDPKTGLAPERHNNAKGPCYAPITKAFIDPEGILRACCHNWDRKLGDHGNVNETPFSELWRHSQSLNDLRKKIYHDRNTVDVCSNCDAGGCTRNVTGRAAKILWKDILSD